LNNACAPRGGCGAPGIKRTLGGASGERKTVELMRGPSCANARRVAEGSIGKVSAGSEHWRVKLYTVGRWWRATTMEQRARAFELPRLSAGSCQHHVPASYRRYSCCWPRTQGMDSNAAGDEKTGQPPHNRRNLPVLPRFASSAQMQANTNSTRRLWRAHALHSYFCCIPLPVRSPVPSKCYVPLSLFGGLPRRPSLRGSLPAPLRSHAAAWRRSRRWLTVP